MITVEILTIGNEILLGIIEDTNSNYLCRLVRGMGGRVRHISIVRDEIDAIAADLNASLARSPDLIFTCGGLGPTDDDLTLESIAAATERPLKVNATAVEFVEQRYRELAAQGYVPSSEMSDMRLKMARLPDTGRPIANPVGAAPAVVLEIAETRVISLPGVPAEMRSIVEGPLQSLLTQMFGRGSYREREILAVCGDESQLAPALRKVVALHTEVYIKSRAARFGPDVRFRINISASAESAEEADRMIAGAAADLTRALNEAGIREQS